MDHVKRRILTHSLPAIDRLRRHRWAALAVSAVSLLSMVAAFAIAPSAKPPVADLPMVVEALPAPATRVLDGGSEAFLREERMLRSDTVASLLNRLGISDRQVLHFLRNDRTARKLVHELRPGITVSARSGAAGELLALHVAVPASKRLLLIERRAQGLVALDTELQFDVQHRIASSEIRSSFFAASDAADVPDAITRQLVEIFGSEIDFHRGLRRGDSFSLVYETLAHRGQTLGSGRILAATVTTRQKTLQAFWFDTGAHEGAYYTADGRSVRNTFLLTPIEFSRLTSGFSDARMHPILQTLRAHKGVDYAAPVGTRVFAVADGVVDSADYQGGYGKLIVLRHQGAYSTAYGHLNDFAAGIRKGVRVQQGDTIGYVGQTGLASGPHLHYEFRVNDEQVDPQALALPTATPLDGVQRARFMASRLALQAQLELAGQITLATIE
ncbi:MAG TPA: M23 family metallopeptidase [Candidatus Accumulibacter phosphatis]|nr:MAG: Glycyl-glycine endopeptidase ALE-1 precursor [Candidatus Accumulibacter sp. SK-11]HAY27977.1 M23 family peptidase [Accumulibacter sp.]HRL76592.1 M23 family metallopeptidase [Candidatus Accumulibacter phosphatis]HCN69513.1 M23 family peptidase [Accumulibacter sp.]HCV13867.1 M23 family peptidase [Accumulibacter sp.]